MRSKPAPRTLEVRSQSSGRRALAPSSVAFSTSQSERLALRPPQPTASSRRGPAHGTCRGVRGSSVSVAISCSRSAASIHSPRLARWLVKVSKHQTSVSGQNPRKAHVGSEPLRCIGGLGGGGPREAVRGPRPRRPAGCPTRPPAAPGTGGPRHRTAPARRPMLHHHGMTELCTTCSCTAHRRTRARHTLRLKR